jgi:hypothetical protein
MYKMHSRNFKTPKITWQHSKTNKWTQRGFQQTTKQNKRHYKKRYLWIKDKNTKSKRGVEQRYGKPQKKDQTEILEIKMSL